jgi:hypothetical protein
MIICSFWPIFQTLNYKEKDQTVIKSNRFHFLQSELFILSLLIIMIDLH